MVSEGERELLSGHTWERMVDLSQVTVGGRREGINTPWSQWSVKCSSAALDLWHCRTCQDSKGQDLNSRLSWLRL
jgi:hypothetical protein